MCVVVTDVSWTFMEIMNKSYIGSIQGATLHCQIKDDSVFKGWVATLCKSMCRWKLTFKERRLESTRKTFQITKISKLGNIQFCTWCMTVCLTSTGSAVLVSWFTCLQVFHRVCDLSTSSPPDHSLQQFPGSFFMRHMRCVQVSSETWATGTELYWTQ